MKPQVTKSDKQGIQRQEIHQILDSSALQYHKEACMGNWRGTGSRGKEG